MAAPSDGTQTKHFRWLHLKREATEHWVEERSLHDMRCYNVNARELGRYQKIFPCNSPRRQAEEQSCYHIYKLIWEKYLTKFYTHSWWKDKNTVKHSSRPTEWPMTERFLPKTAHKVKSLLAPRRHNAGLEVPVRVMRRERQKAQSFEGKKNHFHLQVPWMST